MNKSLKPALDSLNKCEHCREWFSRYNDALRRLGGITTAYRKTKKQLVAVTAERDELLDELRCLTHGTIPRLRKLAYRCEVHEGDEAICPGCAMAEIHRLRALLAEAEGALGEIADHPNALSRETAKQAIAKLQAEGGPR